MSFWTDRTILSLPEDSSKPIHIDLPITKAGAFHYFIEYDGSAQVASEQQLSIGGADQVRAKGKRVRSRKGVFNVDPVLTIPKRASILDPSTSRPRDVASGGGKVSEDVINLPIDGLVIQTIIAKWMGTIEQWGPHLNTTRDRGYNMIHFTPLQQRGQSGSPYSIYNQLDYDDELFKEGKKLSRSQKEGKIRDMLARIRTEWGMLSLTDVVWNHTADNSDWLLDHPEAGYNVENSPHLEGALLLDDALLKLSGELESLGLPTEFKSHDDLDRVMRHISDVTLPALKLWQFYVIDVEAESEQFRKAWTSSKTTSAASSIPQDLKQKSRKEIVDLFGTLALGKDWQNLGGRYHAKIACMETAVAYIAAVTDSKPGNGTDERAVNEVKSILNDLNVDRYKLYNEDLEAILENTKGRIDYTRLASHGPKLGKVTKT